MKRADTGNGVDRHNDLTRYRYYYAISGKRHIRYNKKYRSILHHRAMYDLSAMSILWERE